MPKILFFPNLRMPSGHHQAAEALMDLIKKRLPDAEMKKIDILSETSSIVEKVIATGYMNWIRYWPSTYHATYKRLFHKPQCNEQDLKWYQPILLWKLKQILHREKPDLIFCTHSLPSRLLSRLKLKGECDAAVVNVYTDFFVNSYWGRAGIDAHFLPTEDAKFDIRKSAPAPKRTIVTGIPVHEDIKKPNSAALSFSQKRPPTIVLAGGNSGLGRIRDLLEQLKSATSITCKVLCGNNKKLYKEIHSWNLPHLIALPYLSSRHEMNALYEEADALLTKPGGITVSEALKKQIPLFIHSALPGQEKINLDYLRDKGLVFEVDLNQSLEQQLLQRLTDPRCMEYWQTAIQQYQQEIEIKTDKKMLQVIENLLKLKEKNRILHRVTQRTGLVYSSKEWR